MMIAKNRSRFIINDVTEIPQKKRKRRKQRSDKKHRCVFCGQKFIQIEVFLAHARNCEGLEARKGK